ncbi:MAG: DegV family protein [Oscillospiraceae bacterium]
MNKHKIALLVDSGVDVPAELAKELGIYVVPLKIIFSDGEYIDRVTITPDEVFKKLEKEIPTTSLPSPDEINARLEQIKADGYEKVLGVTISSGLSGTHNVMRLCMEDFEGLECFAVDTKNIAIASGMSAIQAALYANEGMEWEQLKATVIKGLDKVKIFFCVSTLEYLQKGGRIGLVSSVVGNLLNLKPIISCNDDGIYYTVAKVRGRQQSLEKAAELVKKFGDKSVKYNMAVLNTCAQAEADALKAELLEYFPNPQIFVEGDVSPALGIHVGPGAIGLAFQIL